MSEKEFFIDSIKDIFSCGEQDVNAYSPLALAYIGDDVYDLIIRSLVVLKANRPANDLHKMAVRYVKAEYQAKMAEALLACDGTLSEKEIEIYKRGRNAKSYTSAKNASIQDYRKATGFEALIGYLYLCGMQNRIVEIVKKGMELTSDSFNLLNN